MSEEKMLTLRRGIQVLNACTEYPEGIAFNELRRYCDNTAPTTISRILKALIDELLVRKNAENGKYYLAPGFLNLAGKALGARSNEEIIRPLVESLAKETEESSVYFELKGINMVLMAKSEQPDSYHFMDLYGSWGPLHGDPFGQVCLPFLNFSEYKKKLNHKLDKITEKKLNKSFKEIKDKNSLLQKRNLKKMNIIRIAAPVFQGQKRKVVGSIGLTLIDRPMQESELEQYREKVVNAAEMCSKQL